MAQDPKHGADLDEGRLSVELLDSENAHLAWNGAHWTNPMSAANVVEVETPSMGTVSDDPAGHTDAVADVAAAERSRVHYDVYAASRTANELTGQTAVEGGAANVEGQTGEYTEEAAHVDTGDLEAAEFGRTQSQRLEADVRDVADQQSATEVRGPDNGGPAIADGQPEAFGSTRTTAISDDDGGDVAGDVDETIQAPQTQEASADAEEVIAEGSPGNLAVSHASGNEDGAITLDIGASFSAGTQNLQITISGVPAGATLSAGVNNGNGTWTLNAADLQGLNITPAADSDADFALTVTATGTDVNGASFSTNAGLNVTVNAVADDPTLSVNNAIGSEDGGITLDITSALTDIDGSESLSIVVSGVPTGATLSAGIDNGDGTWTLTQAQLTGLTLTPPSNSDADFVLTVTAISTEASNGSSAQTVGTINVRVDAVADAPTLTVSNATQVNPTPAIGLDITSALTDIDGSETLSIVISGVPTGAILSAGIDNGNGTWTLTQAQLAGLSITPPPGSGADFALTVTATSTEAANGDTAQTVGTINVTVTAVHGTAGDDVLTDSDGTDVIYGYDGDDQISGLAGDDLIYGGDGQDTIDGGAGRDTIYGGNDNDILAGGADNDQLYGDAGNDALYGGLGNDELQGGDGNDTLWGEDGNDVIYGGNGNDVAFGGVGNDTIYGNDGVDTLLGEAGNDRIYGGDGDDIIAGGTGNARSTAARGTTCSMRSARAKASTTITAAPASTLYSRTQIM